MIMLCLVGEQPIPNLLPVRYLKPDETWLFHSRNEHSKKSAERLVKLIQGAKTFALKNEYDIQAVLNQLSSAVGDHPDVVVNLTGGTKPMALAAFELARQHRYPVVYYQTEGPRGRDQRSLLYCHYFDEQGDLHLGEGYPCELPALITLDDYLKAYLDGYEEKPPSDNQGKTLEEAVASAIRPYVDEIKQRVVPGKIKDQAEIDLLARCGNQIGVFEIKTGGSGSGKKAVDQLTTVAAREYLGTYAARFLVTQSSHENRYKPLAQALRIRVIELKEYPGEGRLTSADRVVLLKTVEEILPLKTGSC